MPKVHYVGFPTCFFSKTANISKLSFIKDTAILCTPSGFATVFHDSMLAVTANYNYHVWEYLYVVTSFVFCCKQPSLEEIMEKY